jgi:hypothetical protein
MLTFVPYSFRFYACRQVPWTWLPAVRLDLLLAFAEGRYYNRLRAEQFRSSLAGSVR